jgi:nicotinamide mononucleotide transporter
LSEISLFGQTTSWLEIAAMLTGLAGVWLTMRQNIWCFPIGIVNVVLYAWLFFSPGIRLYADALLQCIYVLLLIYGWIRWKENEKYFERTIPLKIDSKSLSKIFLINIAATILLAGFLQKYTNASYPWLDSALTCLSLSAQWMIAKKYIENWIVWIVVDLAYLPLYLSKNLPLTAILYTLFLLMAFKGYQEWKKKPTIDAS